MLSLLAVKKIEREIKKEKLMLKENLVKISFSYSSHTSHFVFDTALFVHHTMHTSDVVTKVTLVQITAILLILLTNSAEHFTSLCTS